MDWKTPARRAFQTTTAAVASFALMRLAGLPELSWAVISAVFVMQPSTGATLGSSADRILATLLGSAFGLLALATLGAEGWRAAAGLAAAASMVELAAWRRPGLRFGHVPAAILLLSPNPDGVMDTALQRAVAITVGGAVAAVVAATVLPERAHVRARRHLGGAARRCGDLLAASVDGLLERRRTDLAPIHGDIQRHLQGAVELSGQSWRRRFGGRHGPGYDGLIHGLQRLWHSLVIVDRIEAAPLPAPARDGLAQPLATLSAEACDYLRRAGEALEAGDAPPPPDAVRRRLDRLQASFERLRHDAAAARLPGPEAQRVFALAFALEQLAGTFGELAARFQRAEDSSARYSRARSA